jgi:hypothetical protein
VEKGLWFNMIPIGKNNINDWQELHKSLEGNYKTLGGYWGFGDVLAQIGKRNMQEVKVWGFIASQKQYEGELSKLSVELMLSVAVDSPNHFSKHYGIQRYHVDTPHKNISVMAHAFCAKVTLQACPDTSHMITTPLSVMRDILYEAFAAQQKTDAITIIWEKNYNKPLPSHDPRKQKAIDSLIKAINEQETWGQVIETKKADVTYHCRDGSHITLPKKKPPIFE